MATFKINNGDSITFAFTLTGVEAADILNLEFAIGNLSYTLANGKLIQSENNPLLFYIYMLSKDTFCLNGNYPISVAINTQALGVLKKNLVGNLAVVKTNTKMNLPVPTQTITATYNFTVDTNGIIVDEFLAQIAKGEPGDSAYEVAVANGFVGTQTQWLLSLKGEQGEQGIQGEQGLTGFAWDTDRVSPNGYLIGEIVNYLGNYYICIANNDAIIPTDSLGVYWNPYSFKGETGEGVATGGTKGQQLFKTSSTNYATQWAFSWEYLVANWTETPTLNATITSGDVYNYNLDGTIRYRFVPSTYTPTQDAFYTNFDGTTLTGLITKRG